MKKNLFALLSMLTMFFLSSSCTKNQSSNLSNHNDLNSQPADNASLSNNSLFQDNISITTDFTQQLIKSTGGDLKKIEKMKAELNALENNSSNMSEDEQIEKISQILNLPSENALSQSYSKLKSNWIILKKQYGSQLTESYIKEQTNVVYTSYLAPKFIPLFPQNSLTVVDQAPTKSQNAGYVICCTGVAAVAQLAYASCLGTIFGAPVCFGLVAIAQTAGIYACAQSNNQL